MSVNRPAGTAYARGAALERRIIAELTERGYLCCRSAGSGGVGDIWCVREGQLYVIQVKRDGYLPPREWNTLYDLAVASGFVPILASAEPRKPVRYARIIDFCAFWCRDRPSEVWEP
jgi:Holliday junction resolvase